MIWTDSYLTGLWDDGEQDAAATMDCIWLRCAIPVVPGTSIYLLNSAFRRISRITYRGRKLEPTNFGELQALDPVGADPMVNTASRGAPYYWGRWPSDYRAVRLYPTPSETLSVDETNINGSNIINMCIVSGYCIPDPTNPEFQIPRWIARRLKKYYVLSRAFAAEGKGQNLTAAMRFKKKYEMELELFKKINAGCFMVKKHQLLEIHPNYNYNVRLRRPVLPPNFPDAAR